MGYQLIREELCLFTSENRQIIIYVDDAIIAAQSD